MSYRKRSRKKNFSPDELAVLRETYEKYRQILESKSNNNMTNKRKHDAWKEITQSVNAVGFEWRGVDEIRKKWNNLCTMAKMLSGGKTSMERSRSRSTTKEAANVYKDEPSFIGIEKRSCYDIPVKMNDSDEETVPRKTICVISIPEEETVHNMSTNREPYLKCGEGSELISEQISNVDDSRMSQQDYEMERMSRDDDETRRKRIAMEEEFHHLRHKTQVIKHNNALLKEEKLKLEIMLLKKRLEDTDNAANTKNCQKPTNVEVGHI